MKTKMLAGLAVGAIAGVAAITAIDAGTETADAQARGGAPTAAQVKAVNRRSIVGIRRANEANEDLAPVKEGAPGWPTDKIADRAITSAKLAAQAVRTAYIADGAVTTEKLADRSVTGAKLGPQAVNTPYIADGAVTAQKLSGGTAGVKADGSKVRGSAVGARVVNQPNWIYAVDFGADVSQCVYQATIGDPGTANGDPGEVEVWASPANANEVVVQTHDSTGSPSARPFHLTVVC